jgi:hypothetical protein
MRSFSAPDVLAAIVFRLRCLKGFNVLKPVPKPQFESQEFQALSGAPATIKLGLPCDWVRCR